MSKTTTLHEQHSFLYDYGVKLPDFTFYGKRKQAMLNFFFFLNLDIAPYSTSRGFTYILQSKWVGIIAM